jgi:DNA-binding transcriptional LysR family regulator
MIPDVIAKNGFSLERLATLCAVVEAGSITAAAGPNPSRQSQFSRQIKELEEALGTRLFDRVGKTLKPTSSGIHLARLSRVFLGAVAELAAREAAKPGLLTVGGGEGTLRWILLPCIPELRALEPPVHCQMRSLRSADVVRELELGRIDVGLVRRSAVPETLATELVGVLEFTLVIPRRLLRSRTADEAYEGKPLAYAELAGEGQLASLARDISRASGIQLNRVVQAETLSLLLATVEREDAAAFLPRIAATALRSERFAQLPIENIQLLSRETVMAWQPEAADQKPELKRALRVLSRGLRRAMTNNPE